MSHVCLKSKSNDCISLSKFVRLLETVEPEHQNEFIKKFTFESDLVCDNPSLEFYKLKLRNMRRKKYRKHKATQYFKYTEPSIKYPDVHFNMQYVEKCPKCRRPY
jgi:hypothetical protein